jgi:hypothetical protein
VRIGAFKVREPIPELNEPYAFATLRPWIDVNNVGTMVVNWPDWLNLVIFSILLVIAQLFTMKRVFPEFPFPI